MRENHLVKSKLSLEAAKNKKENKIKKNAHKLKLNTHIVAHFEREFQKAEQLYWMERQ